MPIRWRLTLLTVAATAVVLLGGGALYLHNLRVGAEAAVDSTLRVRADPVAQALASSDASEGANVDIQDGGSTGLIPPTDALVQVLDPSGQLVDASQAAGRQPLVASARVERLHPSVSTVSPGGRLDEVRVLAVPVTRPDGTWVVLVGTSLASTEAALTRARDELLIAAGPALLLAGIGAFALARGALRPVERMRRQAAAISATDQAARLVVPSTRDEISGLAVTINDLLGRLQDTLIRQRDFVADAGHELRTPLAILRTELELAQRPGRTRAELADAIVAASTESIRLGRLADDLLTLASGDNKALTVRIETVPVAALFDSVIAAATATATAKRVELRADVSDGLSIEGDPGRLRQALDNLVVNAIAHTAPDTVVWLRARTMHDTADLKVQDAGPGFPPDFLDHAFERFRRADDSRTRGTGGTGLGLAIVAAIAEAHRGHAYARNDLSGGATVGLVLPQRHM